MLFEVYKNGKRVFYTNSQKCEPDANTIKQIIAAGYEIRRDGKKVKK